MDPNLPDKGESRCIKFWNKLKIPQRLSIYTMTGANDSMTGANDSKPSDFNNENIWKRGHSDLFLGMCQSKISLIFGEQ